MATTVKTVETELQRRLRIGTLENAVSDANLFDVMNKVQKTLNYALKRKLSTGALTLSTAVASLYYTTTSVAADCLQVRSLYLSSRSIMFVPNWQALQQYDSSWFRTSGSRVEAWSHVGHNMVAVYPCVPTTGAVAATSLTCVYLADTTTLDSSADTFGLADQDMALVYDLCEIVLLAHLRLIPELSRKVGKFQADVLPYIEGGEWV